VQKIYKEFSTDWLIEFKAKFNTETSEVKCRLNEI